MATLISGRGMADMSEEASDGLSRLKTRERLTWTAALSRDQAGGSGAEL